MQVRVIVEVCDEDWDEETLLDAMNVGFDQDGPSIPNKRKRTSIIVGIIEEDKLEELRNVRGIVGVWRDVKFESFEPREPK